MLWLSTCLSSSYGCLSLFEPWASHVLLIKIAISLLCIRNVFFCFECPSSRMLLLPLFPRLTDQSSFETCCSAVSLGCVYFLCYFKIFFTFVSHFIHHIVILCFIACIFHQTSVFDFIGFMQQVEPHQWSGDSGSQQGLKPTELE